MKFTCSDKIVQLTMVLDIGPSWCYNQSYYHRRRLSETIRGKYSVHRCIIIWLYVKVTCKLVYSII